MAPSKWIKINNTLAPGRVYGSSTGSKEYSQQDYYFKMWLPVIYRPNFNLLLGPNYRVEQLEFEDEGENPLHQMSHWKLRSKGLDVRSIFKVDSASWVMINLSAKQSANTTDNEDVKVPINYTLSAIFLKKKSANKEIGFGFMANRSFGRMVVFPVLVYNYNFSSKMGLEVMLPRKISWRHNLSASDILYVRSEAMSRSYYITDSNSDYAFRRTELDMGVAYNRKINKLMGVELFGGYRQNISTRLPNEITSVRTSGLVFSFELYFKSPIK